MRADLLALTPDALATLANRGLVKRAQKELEKGKVPEIAEDAEGVVTASFDGGEVVTTWPPNTALQEADCTCGARGKCRHRVALVLAYQAWAGAQGGEASAEEAPATEVAEWSPGAIEDEALEALLGKRVLSSARRRIGKGMVVELVRAPPPSARLPTCTVRFLVPGDPAYAHCDCELATGCEHVALAVWAFREGDARGGDTAQLGGDRDDDLDLASLAAAESLMTEVLLEGVASAPPSLAQLFARARVGVQALKLTWIDDLLDDLEGTLEAYRQRSARYRAEVAAEQLTELGARLRAAQVADGELPPRFVLGAGEARETRMDHIRLMSLGARLEGDESSRAVAVWLADPDTATVLVLTKRWAFTEGQTPTPNTALIKKTFTTGVPIEVLAKGQLVTRAALRLANRELILKRGSGMRTTSLSPQHGDWGALPPPVLVKDLQALAASYRSRPPRMLRPRIRTEDFHVVAIGEVLELRYAPGDQALVATVVDAVGNPLRLICRYRSAAPGALGAMGEALRSGPTHVSGVVRRTAIGMEMDPVAVLGAGGMVLPDFAEAAGAEAELGGIEAPGSPIEDALHTAAGHLEAGAHQGLRLVGPGWASRVMGSAKELEGLGVSAIGERLEILSEKARTVDAEGEAVARAWLDAAIRVNLALELI
jgi:hypothetical protein